MKTGKRARHDRLSRHVVHLQSDVGRENRLHNWRDVVQAGIDSLRRGCSQQKHSSANVTAAA